MPGKTGLLDSLDFKSQRKKRALFGICLLMVGSFVLTACGTIQNAGNSSTGSSSIKPALELALGTLNLEGTDQAIDADLASELLPLWQLLDELSGSGAAAPVAASNAAPPKL